LLGVNKNTS